MPYFKFSASLNSIVFLQQSETCLAAEFLEKCTIKFKMMVSWVVLCSSLWCMVWERFNALMPTNKVEKQSKKAKITTLDYWAFCFFLYSLTCVENGEIWKRAQKLPINVTQNSLGQQKNQVTLFQAFLSVCQVTLQLGHRCPEITRLFFWLFSLASNCQKWGYYSAKGGLATRHIFQTIRHKFMSSYLWHFAVFALFDNVRNCT